MQKNVKKIILILVIFFVLIFASFEALIIYTGNLSYQEKDYQYLVVLGFRVYGEDIGENLKYRLDKALEFLKTHQNLLIIVSGAGANPSYKESFLMKKYLIEHGVKERQIIEENKSCSTYQNFKNIQQLVGKKKILVVTNEFHMFRSLILAKKMGFEAFPLNAKTAKERRIFNYLREVPAFFAAYFFHL